MVEKTKPVRIAVNVMRSRLTVIGFNIAIVSFMIANLKTTSGGLVVPGVDHTLHVGADMALFMGLALSIISLVAYIISGSLDEVGVCTHWSIIAGDLLMYLALAQTVTGFFSPLATSIDIVAGRLPDLASEISILHAAPIIGGGAAWFLATYAGPIVSLARSPFQRRTNLILGLAYMVILLALSWVGSHAVLVGAGERSVDGSGAILRVCIELIQPFRW